MPAISLHGEEAAADQAKDERGVSMNMECLVRPGLDGLDSCTELGNVIGQTGTYKTEYF